MITTVATRVLVIFPELETAEIENFRARWDPLAAVVPAHLTIAFPFDCSDAASSLAESLTGVAAEHAAFPIRLARPVIWDDEYLFLLMDQGHDEIRQLHESVYRLTLSGVRRPRHFIPHMTVGRRASTTELEIALAEASKLPLPIDGIARAVSMYRREDNGDRHHELEVALSAPPSQ